MYFLKSISDEVRKTQVMFHKFPRAKKLVFGSLFACIAAVLQSAGGFFPGVGYMVSPLATIPILICTLFSFTTGVMVYFLTILLLFILQPSELIVFPFTTGLIGLSIGAAFTFLKTRLSIIISGAIVLTMGILCLLYIFHFPVLGPTVTDSFSLNTSVFIFGFSFFYNWLWVEIALFFYKRVKPFMT